MSQKRAAIERVARRLGMTIPPPLVDALAAFDPSDLGPRWVFTLPPSWQPLGEVVQDDFGQEWAGPKGVVIGENLDGDLVCLLEQDGCLDGAVYLLRHDSLSLERAADSLPDFAAQQGIDEPPPFAMDDDDEPRPEDDYPPLSREESLGLAAALGKLLEEEDAPEPEPLNPALVASIEKALDALILQELLELDPARRPALVEELCASTGEARTPKAMLRRFISCLVESDHPDEVYGTDADIEAALRAAWS